MCSLNFMVIRLYFLYTRRNFGLMVVLRLEGHQKYYLSTVNVMVICPSVVEILLKCCVEGQTERFSFLHFAFVFSHAGSVAGDGNVGLSPLPPLLEINSCRLG